MALFILVILIVLLVLGFPMYMVLIIPIVASLFMYFPNFPSFIIIQRLISGVSPFPLLAVPLFIFAGNIVVGGEMVKRLTNLVKRLIGHWHGGLAQTTVGSSLAFGAISGSTQATVAAIGGIMRPSLLEAKYKDSFILALIINASDVAILIPPSISLIIYGIIAHASIGQLFIGGIGPGILLGAAFMVYCWFYAKKHKLPREKKANIKEVLVATKEASWALALPVVTLGGIYGGIFSPTEAAAVAVVYSILVEIFVYKSTKFKDLPKIALSTGITCGLFYILVAGGAALGWLLTIGRIPQALGAMLLGPDTSALVLLLWVDLFFFVACMFINPIGAMLVLVPIFLPLAEKLGIDTIHLGVLITLNSAIGSATPPFGVDIFTACAVFKKPFHEIVKGTPPFILIGIIVLIITTFVPEITLFLRDLVY